MGKIKSNNKKKQNRHNATGMETVAEVEESQGLQPVPVETIMPLLSKVKRLLFLHSPHSPTVDVQLVL